MDRSTDRRQRLPQVVGGRRLKLMFIHIHLHTPPPYTAITSASVTCSKSKRIYEIYENENYQQLVAIPVCHFSNTCCENQISSNEVYYQINKDP